jgi:hypothetical protein
MVKKNIWFNPWKEIPKMAVHLIKQRRVWAALLSAIAAVAVVYDKTLWVEVCVIVAGTLSLSSFVKPKKKK